MAVGYSSPMRKDKGGRLRLTRGGLHLAELLAAALGDGSSDNPFQEPGLGEFMVFDLPLEQVFSEVAQKIQEIFNGLEEEELARLDDRPDNLTTKEGSQEGEWEMLVQYIDLETDTPGTLKVLGGRAEGVNVVEG